MEYEQDEVLKFKKKTPNNKKKKRVNQSNK